MSVVCHNRSCLLLISQSTEGVSDCMSFFSSVIQTLRAAPFLALQSSTSHSQVFPGSFAHSRIPEGKKDAPLGGVHGSHLYHFYPHPHEANISHLGTFSCKENWEM